MGLIRMTNENRTLLSPTDVSQEFLIPTATLASWRTRGGGPKYCKLGRRVAYRRTDLDAWVDSNSRAHT